MNGTSHTGARIAYFSMEIALDPAILTYSGGLGVLAGDTLRSAADIELPMVALTLAYRKGYFRQHLDAAGNQTEQAETWNPEARLQAVASVGSIVIEGRPVQVRAWRFDIVGLSDHILPVYLLDTDLPGNDPYDRTLTDTLYGGDARYRLCQEAVLGIGGMEMLRALGISGVEVYHMNEGHSALLAIARVEERLKRRYSSKVSDTDIQAVRMECVFTTHTPVPAGHDQFPKELMYQVLGPDRGALLEAAGGLHDGRLNMTYLALRCSHYINGVAMVHGEVSRGMFPEYPIHAITNGVHGVTWTAPAFQELYDRHIPEWRGDNLYLRYAVGMPLEEITECHRKAKRTLLEEIKHRTGVQLDPSILTIGFARRAATYKRADLLFSSLDRLLTIARTVGPFQIVLGGKAHPRDEEGKAVIRRVFEAAAQIRSAIPVIYVENYEMAWAKLICSGVDLWLNTPQRPEEASGTSGMKAALNGIPSLSVLDGWWMEGHVEGVTGWAIGQDEEAMLEPRSVEVASLYNKLELEIIPMFYGRPKAYAKVMRSVIALNGSFFNTQRMLEQYESNAYFAEHDLSIRA